MVCPLVSLMEDQVLALKKLNINAEMMNADTAKEKVSQIFSVSRFGYEQAVLFG